jgi:hypothetical protein
MSTDPTITVEFDSDELTVATAALVGTKSIIMETTTPDERQNTNGRFLEVTDALLEYFTAVADLLELQPSGSRRALEITGAERFTLSTALGHAQAAGDLPGAGPLRSRLQSISVSV